MSTFKIYQDILLKDSKHTYRVIYASDTYTVLCVMYIKKMILKQIQTKKLYNMHYDGEIELVDETVKVYDFSKLSTYGQFKHQQNLDFIYDLERIFDHDFLDLYYREKPKEINKLMEKYCITRKTFRKYVLQYLQSGHDPYSLLDGRCYPKSTKPYNYLKKTGRPTEYVKQGIIVDDTVKEHFDFAINLYKNKRNLTYVDAWDKMNKKYYSPMVDGEPRLVAESKRPTFEQFYYYARKKIDKKTMAEIKTSKHEFRNNQRKLNGKSSTGITGPGQVAEMDAQELNISLVSGIDNTKCVSRAIVYAIVDVYSHVIMAISISFENNSNLGFRNCMVNLAADKKEFCARYNVELTDLKKWPSNIYPQSMRFDRGAEYISKETKRILREMNIKYDTLPPATGSLKGIVEKTFDLLQNKYSGLLEGVGLIQDRHDSKHHEQSTLTIEEVTTILINEVLAHNDNVMKDFNMTHDMIMNNVSPSPSELWKYGAARKAPRPITNIHQFSYAIMKKMTSVKLSRKGIQYKELFYHNPSDIDLDEEIYELGSKRRAFECRMDVCDISKIYYLRNNILQVATLNPMKIEDFKCYENMSLSRYEEILRKSNEIKANAKQHNAEIRVKTLHENEAVIKKASERKKGKSETKHIKENRKEEKERIRSENTINSHLHFSTENNTYVLEEKQNVSNEVIVDDFYDNDTFIEEFC